MNSMMTRFNELGVVGVGVAGPGRPRRPSKPIFGDVPASRSTKRRPSWHCLGPRDMSLVAKRFRHVAVPIPEIRVSRVIAVSPRQKSPQAQQPDLAYHQTLFGWRGRYPLDRGLGLDQVTLGRAIEQCLHQNTCRRNAPPQQPSLAELIVDGRAHERYGAIAISALSLLTSQVDLDHR